MAFLFGCRAVHFLSIMRPMPFAADPGGVGKRMGGGIEFLANCSTQIRSGT